MSVVGPSSHPTRSICVGSTRFAVIDERPPAYRSTVLLVPGYTGSKEDFGPIVDLLVAAGRRVVALDLRGQHETPGPDDTSAYAVAALGADVVAVCAALGDDRVHLVGHSFGGLVARSATIAAPASFASLTLLCTGPAAVAGATGERVRALTGLLATLTVAQVSELGEQDPVVVARPPEVRAFLRRRFESTARAAYVGMGDAILSEADRVAELRDSAVPVLVAHGEGDDAWPIADQADMAARLGAGYVVIPGAMHSPAVETPQALADALGAFWSEVETSLG